MSSLLGSSSAATSLPWIPIRRPSFLTSTTTTPPPSKFFKFHSFSPSPSPSPSSSSCFRVVCSSGGTEGSSRSSSDAAAREFKFVLHDALESSGIHTSHARVKNFPKPFFSKIRILFLWPQNFCSIYRFLTLFLVFISIREIFIYLF